MPRLMTAATHSAPAERAASSLHCILLSLRPETCRMAFAARRIARTITNTDSTREDTPMKKRLLVGSLVAGVATMGLASTEGRVVYA